MCGKRNQKKEMEKILILLCFNYSLWSYLDLVWVNPGIRKIYLEKN